ncbi:amino acid ABC transporter permease [Marinobacter psychrophilus]|jgi:polar amino acid transport system permease protein|uniref:Amino acid ABC transporter permease n=1 Tax=Marinobacter psychrophilus TaxID=330734 RepID=A0A0H4I2Y0_9GAMM|nr:amino acid ABC transporter permease [Marinobacter psychrophilus]AKO53391.1 amino acid ABC transporter permease [Marinobacter psychrophilus]
MTDFTLFDMLRGLWGGLQWTLGLSLLAFVLGGTMGLLILFARMSGSVTLRTFAKVYIELFQGTPLLMQLFMLFFGISLMGLDISPLLAAALGLTLFTSAFLAEIWRGCVQSIPEGQWEATDSLAFSYWEQMRYVILPQAFRIAIPPTVGFSVQVVKGTSVASIIGFAELTKTGTMIANATFDPFTVFGLVALGYFALCWPLSLFARRLEGGARVTR